MDSIISKLELIKLRIKKNEEDDITLKKQINHALATVFCVQTADAGIICDYHLKNGNLILKAKNKVFANELFLKKSELVAAFKENKKVREIVIH